MDIQKTVTNIAEELFSQLEIEGTFELVEKEGLVEILLDTSDSGIVIGYHGESLEALQLLLSLMVSKKLGSFLRISVEVGDYKKNRSAYLEKLAMQVKERALAENREQILPQLKSWERRVIHMILQEDADVVSESVGEGKERSLVIKPRN